MTARIYIVGIFAALALHHVEGQECSKTSSDCAYNKVCYNDGSSDPAACDCPVGYEGSDCMQSIKYSDRCPYPIKSEFKEQCLFQNEVFLGEDCTDDRDCATDEICCLASDACLRVCVPLGCKNPQDVKTCYDQHKICVDDDSADHFTCVCPYGYSGYQCKIPHKDFDKTCYYPTVPDYTCPVYHDWEPDCYCDDDEICCSDGCGPICLDSKHPPPKKNEISPLLLLLLLSLPKKPAPPKIVYSSIPFVYPQQVVYPQPAPIYYQKPIVYQQAPPKPVVPIYNPKPVVHYQPKPIMQNTNIHPVVHYPSPQQGVHHQQVYPGK